jgi:hypothetical protein
LATRYEEVRGVHHWRHNAPGQPASLRTAGPQTPQRAASPPARAGASREPMRSAAGNRTGVLEYDPQTSSGAPNHTATLPGAAEHQLKSIWQLGLPRYLEACPAGGIIYNSAIDDGSFRVNDQFGHGISRRRPNTCEPSRIHRRSSKTTRATVNFAEYFECFVERYSYRNVSAAARKQEISCIGSYLSSIRHQANYGWGSVLHAWSQSQI